MSLALASRGYLCVPLRLLPRVDLPTGTVTEAVPQIIKVDVTRDRPPIVRRASTPVPEIRGAEKTADPTAPSSPSITKGTTLVPTIRKVKKT